MNRKIPLIKGADIMFRTHNFGELMGAITKTELTAKQKIDLKDLQSRIVLTENQAKERDRLLAKQDSRPELSVGGKTLIQTMFDELVRGIKKKEVKTNQTEKGLMVEDSAINRIAKVNGWGHFINANKLGIELRDKYGIGHPDAIKTNVRIGFDAKASYSGDTFPLWDEKLNNKIYDWQAKRLAMMAKFDTWFIAYSLENTPEHLVISEAKKLWYQSSLFHDNGHLFNNEYDLTPVGEKQKQHLNDVFERHNFDHLADWERVKTFEVTCSLEDIKLMSQRAELGRDYFDKLMEEYLTKQKKHEQEQIS